MVTTSQGAAGPGVAPHSAKQVGDGCAIGCDRTTMSKPSPTAATTAGATCRSRRASLLRHPGLAQTFEHMSVVLWPSPRGALSHIHAK
jgi:hypothetical protein